MAFINWFLIKAVFSSRGLFWQEGWGHSKIARAISFPEPREMLSRTIFSPQSHVIWNKKEKKKCNKNESRDTDIFALRRAGMKFQKMASSFLNVLISQCESLGIFLPLWFYVKSTLAYIEWKKTLNLLNHFKIYFYGTIVEFSHYEFRAKLPMKD